MCHHTVGLEDNFIDLAFEMGPVNGMTADEIKRYIRYIADWRLGQLGLKPMFLIKEHPALARPAAQRRGARQLLRTARDGIFEGRDARELERGVGSASTSARRRRAARPRTRMPGTARAAGTCSRRLAWRRVISLSQKRVTHSRVGYSNRP